jgi:carboxyl-terminal processing protease
MCRSILRLVAMRGLSPLWCVVVALSVPHVLAAESGVAQTDLPGPFERQECFDKVWRSVREQFWDPNFNGVDWEEAGRRYKPEALAAPDHEAFGAVVNRMLAELRTSHTCYLTKWDPDYYTLQVALISQMLASYCTSDPADFEKYAPGRYSSQGRPHRTGIGVVTKRIEGRHYVSRVLRWSPAEKAGVLAGDLLIEVDGEPFHPIRSFEGRADREVELVLRRGPSDSTRRAVRLTPIDREEKELFEADSQDRTGFITHEGRRFVYVPLWWLSGWQMRDVFDRACDLAGESQGMIIDLRYGFGGSPAIEYIDPFLRSGLQGIADESVLRDRKISSKVVFSGPVIVLINGDSRSGKELLAWYFKKTGRGTLLGERTAGSVTGGRLIRICDESVLYCCVSMITIDGKRLEGVGVEPDIQVPFDIRFAAGGDPQLDRAKAELVRLSEAFHRPTN